MYASTTTFTTAGVAVTTTLQGESASNLPILSCAEYGVQHKDQAPVLLLHGFDSSSLEFRRLLPLLEQKLETWAVDLVGWGFSDSGAASHKDMQLGPKQKRDHLYAFWKEKVMLHFAGSKLLHNLWLLTSHHADLKLITANQSFRCSTSWR